MNKQRLGVLSLLALLALGLWFLPKRNPAATSPNAIAAGNPTRVPTTVGAAAEAAATHTPKIIPRAAGTVLRRPGSRRVPTTADAVAIGGRAPASMPLASDFLEKVTDASGTRATFTLPDGRAAVGSVELLRRDADGVLLVQGRLSLPESGFYFFQRQTALGVAGALVGNVRFDKSDIAFLVVPTGPGGSPMLVEHRLDQVVCLNLIPPDLARMAASEPEQAPQAHPIAIPIPEYQNGIVPLQSLPGASGVIYLDFDGELGPFTGWGSFDAVPSGATNEQIKDVWQRVCEDYEPFNLNITTDRKIYDNAGQGHRMHVILTPTTTAAPGSGGVAYVGSFNNTGDTPCWVFYWTGKPAAEVVSHEVGHTLGLSHDGRISPAENYYAGHGAGETGWAPIMGVGYYQNLVQWSKGEYLSANNTEDDLSIIVNNNNTVDYRVDDATATFATAPNLEILADDTVANEGIIETRTDVDAFRFTTAGGAVSLTVSTVNASPDLDILAEIYDSANVLVASNNSDFALSATVSTTLAAGDFTLRVSGIGRGDPLVDGYTDYACLGAYLISGTVPDGIKPDRFSTAENTANGITVGNVAARLAHGANPLIYAIASGNTGSAFAIDPITGAITVNTASQLNFETLSTRWDDPATIQLFVTITDANDALLNETIRVVVTVTDVNEPPLFTGGAVTIPERARIGTNVFKITASDPDHYDFPLFSIVAGNAAGTFAIDPVSGQITIAGSTEASVTPSHTLTVRATDHGTPTAAADATVTVTLINIPDGYTPGTVVRSFYENITGTAVTSLTASANFPNSPNSQQNLPSFDGGLNHGDNYGDTIRGFLIPPTTGNYTFWISSDDGSELRISPNATPTSAIVRATLASASNQYQWTANASQQSVALALTAGTPYYIEARHKESTGTDHIAVAWQGPGITQQVIGGAYLALQSLDLVSPTSTNVNIPAGTGIAIDGNNHGRTGTTFAWMKISGPGTVTFDNATALSTGAVFSAIGTYVLRCTESGAATPIVLELTVNAGIVVNVANIGTWVYAGGDASVTLPANATLDGTVTDDARPAPPAAITTVWSKTSGPGNVAFGNATAIDTTAAITIPGSYTLRLTADDGAVRTFDEVAINVASATTVNLTASDSAASEQGPGTGQFTFTRTGPTEGAITVNFTIGGTASASDYAALPATVVIPDAATSTTLLITPNDDTIVEGSETVVLTLAPGVYNLGSASIATVTIADNDVVPTVTITSPTAVNVNIPANTGLILEATTTDDGLPDPVALMWSKMSGPGTVTFGSVSATNTTATFSAAGTYVLRLTASDGQFSGTDEATVNVGVVDPHFIGTKVGAQAIQPSHTFSEGTYTMSAAGAGIPSKTSPDDFYFLNTPATGDVTITARLVRVEDVSASNSRAGVMIRNSLAADAMQAFCGVTSQSSGRWIRRTTAGANSVSTTVTAGQPYWVRLIRAGNTFTAQFAPDSSGAPGTFSTADRKSVV